ncbi:MAG: galactose-1-epimerase, partial [Telluria sp.]
MNLRPLALSLCAAAVLMTVGAAEAAAKGQITKQAFGKTPDGQAVNLYTLSNGRGMTAQITNYGGIVTSLKVPDRSGKAGDVVLGFDTLAAYIKGNPLFGAVVGRYANRIRGAKIKLDGKTYT